MRLFVAIDISKDIKSSISDIIRKIGDVEGIKWASEDGMHLTLKFLGEVKEELVSDIKAKLQLVADRHMNFIIEARGVGGFPNFSRPRVLWIGFRKSRFLSALVDDIEMELEALGFSIEKRPFTPHLTIGRVKDARSLELALKELSIYKDAFFGNINVKEILLMKSVLKPSGAEYSKIAAARLREGAQ